MPASRRTFLKNSGLTLAAGTALLHAPFAFSAGEAEHKYTHDLLTGFRQDPNAANYMVRRASFDTGKREDMPVSFEPHSFLQHPQDPARVWVIENFGGNAIEIDFKAKKISREIIAPLAEQKFMGHAFFTPDAKNLCITSMDIKTGEGGLALYETGNYTQTDFHKATPGNLHQCMLLPDNTVYITSLGRREGNNRTIAAPLERSSLVQIGLDGKPVGKKFLESDEQSIGHFTVMADGTIIAVTRTIAGAKAKAGTAYISDKGKSEFKEINWPPELRAKFTGSMLGVAVDEKRRIAAISSPYSSLLMLLDTRDWSTIGTIEKCAKGVEFSPESGEFLCSGNDIFRAGAEKTASGAFPVTTLDDTAGVHSQHNLIVPKLI